MAQVNVAVRQHAARARGIFRLRLQVGEDLLVGLNRFGVILAAVKLECVLILPLTQVVDLRGRDVRLDFLVVALLHELLDLLGQFSRVCGPGGLLVFRAHIDCVVVRTKAVALAVLAA